jgi:hypothetical protein
MLEMGGVTAITPPGSSPLVLYGAGYGGLTSLPAMLNTFPADLGGLSGACC